MAGGQIFQGVTTSPTRDYVAKEIKASGAKKIYMPCVGRFAALEAYTEHGGDFDNVYSSDISLFSSIIGYIADKSKNFDDLGIVIHGDIQPRSDNPLDVGAAVMLILFKNQLSPKNKYGINQRRELMLNLDKHYDDMRNQLESITNNLAGINYDIVDLWDVIEEVKGDNDSLIFLNVPTYSGGYTRMFATNEVEWNDPQIEEFKPKEYEKMMDDLLNNECKVLAYVQKTLDNIGEGWNVVFAQPYKHGRTDYIVANFDTKNVYAHAKTRTNKPRIYPIYNDQEITPDSKISFIKTDRDTCLYYRDLFVHKLGSTQAEQYYLFLIDGRVVTAFGLALREVLTRKTEYLGEVFGISKSSKRYMRLGKLFMLCLTSGDMKKYLLSEVRFGINEPKGIQTTSLTTFHEGKTDRSVMKLVFREKLNDTQYRVIYRADFREDTFEDCIIEWLDKWGHVSRKSKKNRKKV